MKNNLIKECFNKFDYQEILCDLILTQFNKEIKYDYTIPSPHYILKIVLNSLNQWTTKVQLKKDIIEVVEENNSEDSILRKHLWNDRKFGHEWFCMIGDFFKYRKEEKAKAISKYYSNPKLANYKIERPDKSIYRFLKKDVQDFIDILSKNIKIFYKDYEKSNKN